MSLLIEGHRGYGSERPHNTIAAFEAAAASSHVCSVEFDVREARTGELVVTHGPELAGKGQEIEDLSWDELQAIDLGEGQRMPSLRAVVETCVAGGLVMNCEIKTDGQGATPENPTPIVQRVLDCVRAVGAEAEALLKISSFRREVILRVREVAPHIPLGCLYNPGIGELPGGGFQRSPTPSDFCSFMAPRRQETSPRVEGYPAELFFDSVNLCAQTLTKDEADEARAAGWLVMAWFPGTLPEGQSENAAFYKRVQEHGARVVCVNEPSLAEAVGVRANWKARK